MGGRGDGGRGKLSGKQQECVSLVVTTFSIAREQWMGGRGGGGDGGRGKQQECVSLVVTTFSIASEKVDGGGGMWLDK